MSPLTQGLNYRSACDVGQFLNRRHLPLVGPGNGSPMATNVVVVVVLLGIVVVIRFTVR